MPASAWIAVLPTTATPSDEDKEEADDEEEALAREKDRAGFFQGSLPP